MTKALLMKDAHGLYIIDPDWEEISQGIFGRSEPNQEPVVNISTKGEAKVKEIQKGLYEILDSAVD